MSYDPQTCNEVKDDIQDSLPNGWEVRCGSDSLKYYDNVNNYETSIYPEKDAVLLPAIATSCPPLDTRYVTYVLEKGIENGVHLKNDYFFNTLHPMRDPNRIVGLLEQVKMTEWDTFYWALRGIINETKQLPAVDKYMRCLIAKKAKAMGGRGRKTKRRKLKRGRRTRR